VLIEVIRRYRAVAMLLVLGLVLLFLDFWSKSYIYNVLPHIRGPHGGIPVFSHFLGGIDFSINLAFNRGAAWGLFADMQIPLLCFRIAVVLALLVYLIFFNKNRQMLVPLVLIITGAIGNIVDFFLYGSVVDFLLFTFWGWHFPLFNLADSMITIGVVLLLALSLFSKKKASIVDGA